VKRWKKYAELVNITASALTDIAVEMLRATISVALRHMTILARSGRRENEMVTEYTEICAICGRPRECEHHLIYGSTHKLADEDGLTLPMCHNCHNMGKLTSKIHGNSMAESLSKIAGQLAWEKEYYKKIPEDPAREAFRKRYGVSYL